MGIGCFPPRAPRRDDFAPVLPDEVVAAYLRNSDGSLPTVLDDLDGMVNYLPPPSALSDVSPPSYDLLELPAVSPQPSPATGTSSRVL